MTIVVLIGLVWLALIVLALALARSAAHADGEDRRRIAEAAKREPVAPARGGRSRFRRDRDRAGRAAALDSAVHRAVLLDPDYRDAAIAAVATAPDGEDGLTLVADLGRRRC